MAPDYARYDDPEQLADALQLLADLARNGMPVGEQIEIVHASISMSFHEVPDGIRAWAALLGEKPTPWLRLDTGTRLRRVKGEYASHVIEIAAFDAMPGAVIVQVDDARLQQDEPVKGEPWTGELPASLRAVGEQS